MEIDNMRYKYGTNDSYTNFKGKNVTAKELASIIKRDVEVGKWNIYEGGRNNSTTAHCRYQRKGFIYHEQLLIYGKPKEFKQLETLIKDFIEVKPRQYN